MIDAATDTRIVGKPAETMAVGFEPAEVTTPVSNSKSEVERLQEKVHELSLDLSNECAENAYLCTRKAELESVIAELTANNHRISKECGRLRTLVADLCEVLKKNLGQTGRSGDAEIAVAAKLLVESDMNFSKLVLILARAIVEATSEENTGLQIPEQPASRHDREASPRRPMPWDYKEEPDIDGGVL
jgi:hypothetical protein